MLPSLVEDSVSARISASSTPQGQAVAPRTPTYTATVRTAQGSSVNIPIGRPEFEMWPESGPWVFPLLIGTRIYGRRLSTGPREAGRYVWQYTETPRMRLCGT